MLVGCLYEGEVRMAVYERHRKAVVKKRCDLRWKDVRKCADGPCDVVKVTGNTDGRG